MLAHGLRMRNSLGEKYLLITVDSNKINEDLINYPLMIKLDSNNFDFSKCMPDGRDIRFKDISDNELKFEKVEFGNGIALINVNIPFVSSSSDTHIKMEYGDKNLFNTSIEAANDLTSKPLNYFGNVKMSKTFSDVTTWRVPKGVTSVDLLIVGGGGGGGMDMGGGGGGGEVLYKPSHPVTPGEEIIIQVGRGGDGAPAAGTLGQPAAHQFLLRAKNGQPSKFGSLQAEGGGYGGSSYVGYTPDKGIGGDGASGGGSSGYDSVSGTQGGKGIPGKGYNGGHGGGSHYSGGGGGAGGVGTSGPAISHGGPGLRYTNMSPYFFGGGGGGSAYTLSTGGNGGVGGGGGGAVGTTFGGEGYNNGKPGGGGSPGAQTNKPGGDAGANTGGGGGGGSHYNANNKGGDGGSGIVIIKYTKDSVEETVIFDDKTTPWRSYAELDGVGDYFETPNNKDFNFSTKDFCIEFQAVFNAYPSYVEFLGNNNYNAIGGFWLEVGTARRANFAFNGTLYYFGTGALPITTGVLTTLKLSRENGQLYLYHNGIQVGSAVACNDNITSTNSLKIGTVLDGVSYAFNGKINGLRLTNGRSRRGTSMPNSFEIDGEDVVFCTNFDTIYDSSFDMVQHLGTSLIDASGKGNNGTNVNTIVNTGLNGEARRVDVNKSITFPTMASIRNGSVQVMLKTADNQWLPFTGTTTSYYIMANGPTALFYHSAGTPIYTYVNGVTDTKGRYDNTWQILHATNVDLINFASFKLNNYDAGWNVDNGLYEELRVSNVVRTNAWIKADDHNLRLNDLVSITNKVNKPEEYVPATKNITIYNQYIDAALQNYPVMVKLDSNNTDFSTLRDDGKGIKFTDEIGNTLSFEEEYFSKSESRAVYHVKMPTISNTINTKFKMVSDIKSNVDYSDKFNVWDSNYIVVQHMGESLLDSTSNANNIANTGTINVDGLNGKARSFTTANKLEIASNASLNLSNKITMTVIAQYTTTSNATFIEKGPSNDSYQFQIGYPVAGNMEFRSGTGLGSKTTVTNADNKIRIYTGTYDGSKSSLYVDNGSTETQVSSPLPAVNSSPLLFGSRASSLGFNGVLHEFRLSNIVRSNAWIKADYHNLLTNNLINIER